MKNKIIYIILALQIVFLISSCFSTRNQQKIKYLKDCPDYTSDSAFNDTLLLNFFADTLNYYIDALCDSNRNHCRVENGRPVNFFVYDLVDTTNNTTDCEKIVFNNSHIYHISTHAIKFSYSQIVILENDAVKIFCNVNCSSIQDNIETIIEYITENNIVLDQNQEVITRLKNYRKFGDYFRMCNYEGPPEGCTTKSF